MFADRFFGPFFYGNRYFGPDTSGAVVVVTPSALTYGAAPHTLEARVRAYWERIEEIERRQAEKEREEAERVRAAEEAKRALAELEAKKRQTKTLAARRAKLAARIAAYEAENAAARLAINAMADEVMRLLGEIEQQRAAFDLRRRMLMTVLLAAA